MTYTFTLLFMFLVFWRPQDWLLPFLFGWPILDVLVFVALLTLLLEVNQNKLVLPKYLPQVWLLLGLWLATLVSHVAHTYFEGLMVTLPETFKFCFFSFLLILVLDSPRKLRVVAWLFVSMAAFMSVHALLQQSRGYGFAGQPPMYFWRPLEDRYVLRSLFFGIFEDPNDLAQFIVCAMPFVFVLFRRLNVLTLGVGCGLLVLLFQGFMAANSRGGLVALAVAGVLAATAMLKAKRQPIVLLVIIVLGLAVFPYAGTFMDASARDRVVFWGDANLVFKANPLFGVGYGLVNDYMPEGRAVHNAYVECYTAIGVFGYWFWFGLLISVVMGIWRVLRMLGTAETVEEKWMRRFTAMALASFGGFMASAYFLSRAFVYPLFFLIAILAAIPLVWRRGWGAAAENIPSTFTWKRFAWLNTILSLGSVVYIYVSILILNRVW